MSLPFERPTPARLPPFPRSLRRIVLWIIAAVFIVLTVIPWLASFFTDWLWFGEIGFRTVFATSLLWRIALFVLGGFLLVTANMERAELTAFIRDARAVSSDPQVE